MALVAVTTGNAEHTGSTIQGPVDSSLNSSQDFSRISTDDIVAGGSIDTPSHAYATSEGGDLYHSHPGQSINISNQDYVRIDGDLVRVEGDGNSSNVTIITDAGQDFVRIN